MHRVQYVHYRSTYLQAHDFRTLLIASSVHGHTMLIVQISLYGLPAQLHRVSLSVDQLVQQRGSLRRKISKFQPEGASANAHGVEHVVLILTRLRLLVGVLHAQVLVPSQLEDPGGAVVAPAKKHADVRQGLGEPHLAMVLHPL